MDKLTLEQFSEVTKHLGRNPAALAAFRDACEKAGVKFEMTVREKECLARKYLSKRINEVVERINELKDVKLPYAEYLIKSRKLHKEDSLRTTDIYYKTKAVKDSIIPGTVRMLDGVRILNCEQYKWVHHPDSSKYLVFDIPNFHSLPVKLRKRFFEMQLTLDMYSRHLYQKELKELRKELKTLNEQLRRIMNTTSPVIIEDVYGWVVKNILKEAGDGKSKDC